MYDPVTHFHSIECRYCQQTFKTRFGRRRYCSDQCKLRARPTKPRTNLWTYQEDRLLRQLAGEVSTEQIAARLGRTRMAVKTRARKLKISLKCYGELLPRTKHSDILVEQARTLNDEGLTTRAIAVRLRVPRRTVRAFCDYTSRLGPPIERYF